MFICFMLQVAWVFCVSSGVVLASVVSMVASAFASFGAFMVFAFVNHSCGSFPLGFASLIAVL